MSANLLHRGALTAFAIAAVATLTHADLVDPVLVGQSTFTGNPLHVFAQSNTVAVSSSNSNVHLFDVTDPASPQPIASIPTSGPAYESQIHGSTLFVACGLGGCDIIDITDPLNPQLIINLSPAVDEFGSPSDFRGLDVDGSNLYLPANNSSFGRYLVYDISSLATPSLLGNPGVFMDLIRDVEIEGDYAFLLGNFWGLKIVDITQPANPATVYGPSSADDFIRNMVRHEGYVYMAEGGQMDQLNLRVFDATDPASASEVSLPQGFGKFGGAPAALVAACDSLIHFPDWHWDISDPSNPVFMAGGLPALTGMVDGAIANGHLYAAGENGDFSVFSGFGCDAPNCPGDVTGDGEADLADLNLVLANFGQTTSEGDTNDDGKVDLADLNAVLAAFGTGCD